MANIPVQSLPANGQGFGGITFTAASAGGDSYTATGNEIVVVKGQTGWTSETVQVEGVPGADAARDGTATLDPGSLASVDGGGLDMAGPFKPRNWNNGSTVELTYPGGETGLGIAIVRFTAG